MATLRISVWVRLSESTVTLFLTEGGVKMPTYEFSCEKCKKPFTLVISLSEYEKKKFQCPKCQSTDVKQMVTSFQTKTSKKS